MSFTEKIYKNIFYMGISKEQFHQIKEDILEDNRRTITAGAMCTNWFWAISLIMSFHFDSYSLCKYVYAIALVCSIVTLIAALFVAKKKPNIILGLICFYSISLLGAGIGISYFQPDVRTVTLIAFVIIFPTLIIKNTFTDIVMVSITSIVYTVLCSGVVEKNVFHWTASNVVIFGMAGILMAHVINKERCYRFMNVQMAMELAEVQKKYANYDQLTGLKNRRAFEEKIKEIGDEDDISVVMLDLNGLKKANDSFGHEAGDELLVATSKCLQQSFEDNHSIYRIGGDEFCVIHNGPAEEALKCLKTMDNSAACWKGQFINGFTISYGVASRDDRADISSVIKLADQKMYQNKRSFYAN